jgi:hypothetical protein
MAWDRQVTIKTAKELGAVVTVHAAAVEVATDVSAGASGPIRSISAAFASAET